MCEHSNVFFRPKSGNKHSVYNAFLWPMPFVTVFSGIVYVMQDMSGTISWSSYRRQNILFYLQSPQTMYVKVQSRTNCWYQNTVRLISLFITTWEAAHCSMKDDLLRKSNTLICHVMVGLIMIQITYFKQHKWFHFKQD